MKIIKIGDGYYCCTDEKIVISKLFKDCCIKNKVKKGSFAAQFLNKLLIYLFQYAIDLEEEYKTYYSEYKSFTAYLHEKNYSIQWKSSNYLMLARIIFTIFKWT